jgi:hypothetical protein
LHPLGSIGAADKRALELIGNARVNNSTEHVVFRIAAHQAHLSEIRVRSGSLAIALVAVEIEFADGAQQRALLQDSLAPGHQSRSIPVDRRRALRRIVVMKRPGPRDGETALQVLGLVE